MATIHFSPFTFGFRRFFLAHSQVLFAMRTPNSQNRSYVHYSLALQPLLFSFSFFFVALRFSLLFLCFFPFFSRDFKGSAEREILVFFRGVLAFLPKKKGLEGQGSLSKFTGEWFTNHSDHIHIFTPITRRVATKVRSLSQTACVSQASGMGVECISKDLLLVELKGLCRDFGPHSAKTTVFSRDVGPHSAKTAVFWGSLVATEPKSAIFSRIWVLMEPKLLCVSMDFGTHYCIFQESSSPSHQNYCVRNFLLQVRPPE